MFQVFATNVIIAKGYEDAPALKFSENGDLVRFRIGKKVYDPKAENDSRWINMPVKAFGKVCERVKKMKLGAGSFINLSGRLDEDRWIDEKTGEKRSVMVIILDSVEYAGAGKPKESGQSEGVSGTRSDAHGTTVPALDEGFDNFTGYEPFDGSPFFS